MEGIGLVILALIGIAWFMYTAWRDNRRWNEGICKETGQPWRFTGGISYLGQYCYMGGAYKGRQQFIWLAERRRQSPKFGPGTNC